MKWWHGGSQRFRRRILHRCRKKHLINGKWGYRGDILKTYAGEKAFEVAPDFEPPAGLVFDAIVSLDVDRGSYVAVLMHDGCMASWRLYTLAGKT